MEDFLWGTIGKKLRSGNRSLENCHAVGTCLRFLSRRVIEGHRRGCESVFDETRIRLADIPGITSTLLRDCVCVATTLTRREAGTCISLTISHFRELRDIRCVEAKRDLLLEAERLGLTCRGVRDKAMSKLLELWGGFTPCLAGFISETIKVSREIRAARLRLVAMHDHTAKTGVDREYVDAVIADWQQRLLAIETEIFELTTELGTTPAETTEETAAA